MSEQEATAEPAPLSRSEQIEQAWNAANAQGEEEAAPETIEASALDEKPETERVSVAPSIRDFIKSQRTEEPGPTNALEKEIAELRSALDSIANRGSEPAEVPPEQAVLSKLEQLEARERERLEQEAEAKAQEDFNQRVASLRAGAVENINARAEDFPALVALEQQETVVNALFQRLDEGVETSEDEIASEVEAGLWEVYEKLHKLKSGSQSQAQQPASERQQTLNPTLTGTDEEVDYSKMSRREKIDYLWAKNQ